MLRKSRGHVKWLVVKKKKWRSPRNAQELDGNLLKTVVWPCPFQQPRKTARSKFEEMLQYEEEVDTKKKDTAIRKVSMDNFDMLGSLAGSSLGKP